MKTQRALTISVITATLLTMAGCTANGTYMMCTTGNVDTNIKSYSADHDYKNILIYANGDFPSLMCNEFTQKGVNCQAYDQVFSPLESYTTSQVQDGLKAGGFDSVMIVSDSVSSTSTSDLGSLSQINAFSSGATVSTTNLKGYTRADKFGVVVYDTQTQKKVYLANTATSGYGAACVNNYVYLRSAAEKLTVDMLK
nr:hypothetical protein [uncultured Vibrio sp.]